MKKSTHIKLKAAFLLLVLGLNTVVGFACSVGVDMGYNSNHHKGNNEVQAAVHVHKDCKKHIYHEKTEKHDHNKTHHNKSNPSSKSSSNEKDCCSGPVTELQQLDKSLPNNLNIAHPVFAIAFLSVFYKVHLIPQTDITRDIRQVVRSYHPPIADIRIAIQSFQI